MRHGSLFSGIGGFDLASEWMGWDNVFHCEWNEFGSKILKHYWPKAISYADITKTDFTIHRGQIDILTGGFPCQPYSAAGKRLGTADDRHLWPEMLRAIREIQPTFVVGENVRGLTNWNGGLVFDQVQADLEAEGYEVTPFLLPACAVNAPHRRDRIWFIAYCDQRSKGTPGENRSIESNRSYHDDEQSSRGITGEQYFGCREFLQPIADTYGTNSETRPFRKILEQSNRHQANGFINVERPNQWQNFPTQSPIRKRNDGLSRQLVKYLTPQLYHEISNTSKENRVENLQEMWNIISQEEVWEKIRGFYSLESKSILLQTMQLYSSDSFPQGILSPFCEKVSEPILQKLQHYGEFRSSPQGQELEKQRSVKLANIVSLLPHEIPLAAKAFEASISKFDAWHRNESIKGYGNAIVPQVAYQIFKAINNTTT